MSTLRDMTVAAGVPPAVEAGILPGGLSCGLRRNLRVQSCHSGRQDAALYGSQEYPFSVVGISRCDVRAACSGATPSNATVTRTFILPATTRARTAQRAIPTIALNGHRQDGCRCNGFTLVEIIAVLAIMAVLVGVVAPSVIRRIDRAAWTKETADLNTFADALNQSIIRTKTIPSYTNWASTVASQMSLPVSVISTNSRRYARAFLIDPSLSINGALPYTQTPNGTTKPVSARVMIVSSLARALPASVTNGVASAADFTAIWNAAENTVPAGPAFSGWGGTGEDLRIKKLNLEPLFYQLILVNHSGNANTVPRFSIDENSNTTAVTNWLNKYYLDSTVIGLYGATTNLQTRHLLKRSISFLFESDAWRGQVQGGESYSSSGDAFYNTAVTFFSRPINPAAEAAAQTHGVSQYGVMIAMYTFMFDYVYWANQCPHFANHGQSPSGTPEFLLLDNQGKTSIGNIDRFSANMIVP